MIKDKGLTAPRVTPAMVEAEIRSEHYFTAADGIYGASCTSSDPQASDEVLGRITFCVLVLQNGFTTIGQSACVHPANFDAEIGRQIARRNAVDEICPLLGYALAQELHEEAMIEDNWQSLIGLNE